MTIIDFGAVQIGDELPDVVFGPVNRSMLALYAGASGDDNPIHIDLDFAKKAGLPDVFAHGMLIMAQLGRVVTGWTRIERVHALTARFSALTQLGDVLTCSGRVAERIERDGKQLLRVELVATTAAGGHPVVGDAEIFA
jgi:acyl dehydratase